VKKKSLKYYKKVFDFNKNFSKSITFYKKYGFVIYKNLIGKNHIQEINFDLRKIISQQYFKYFSDTKTTTDEKLIKLSKKNDKFRERIYKIIQDLPSNKRLCLNKNFYKICKSLKLNAPTIKSNQIRMDLPFSEKFLIPPHQEIKGTKSDNLIFFITALTKTTKDMGAISLYPESFKLGPLIPNTKKNKRYQFVNPKYFKNLSNEKFNLQKGETIFLNMYTIHGSNKNVSENKIRWSSIIRFEDFSRMPYLDLNDEYLKYDLKG